jgi:hypothetical protein
MQPTLGKETPPLETPLQINKLDHMPHVPKGVLKLPAHNPNSRAAQNYLIVEYLGQTSCAISALEVRSTCPT